MTNRAIVLWSLALALPVQYCWLLASLVVELMSRGIEHYAGSGNFGCLNFHDSGLWPCTFGEMLMNPLVPMFLINVFSVGLAFLLTASIIGVMLVAWRRWSKGSNRESATN